MKTITSLALCSAAAVFFLAPSAAIASPGYMTCQIHDGDRNRVFYSAQPVAADSGIVDNAYDFYLQNVLQSGMMGDVSKAEGNCNWEASRSAAATKVAAFVRHFVTAGANPFPDRFVPDPYIYHTMAASSAPAAAPPAAAAPAPSSKPRLTVSESKNGICTARAESDIGWAESQIQLENGLMKGMRWLLVPTLKSAPGKGAAKGGQVLVHFDMNIISLETTEFDGLGTRLVFPEHTVVGPIDLRVTVGDVVLTKNGLTPSADGSYQVRMGGGPFKTNPAVQAIDKSSVIEVLATVAGARDQPLVYADIPIGTPDGRDALLQTAMDDTEKRSKVGC